MDEAEWLSSTDSQAMLFHLENERHHMAVLDDMAADAMRALLGSTAIGGTIAPRISIDVARPNPLISERKKSLFACAWWSSIQPHDMDQRRVALGVEKHGSYEDKSTGETIDASWLLRDCQGAASASPIDKGRAIREKGAALLREIMGNPFRPLASPRKRCTWCAGDGLASHEDAERKCKRCGGCGSQPLVLRIAQTIHDQRTFDEMPILADALEEAGCEEVEILRHLRLAYTATHSPRCGTAFRGCAPDCPKDQAERALPHVRGCHVLDLLLGLS